ncbi:MAG TPA: alpha/beta hydrolase [Bryobacteraceae bacterium]|nr:alpha/beta hydrolase [Bryobacteraceae bacterium]
MKPIYRSAEGERLVRERCLAFLEHWPVPNRQVRIPTSQGETFVVISQATCSDEGAPPLLLLHGGAGNSAMWMGEVRTFAAHFHVYAIDMIGEAGLSAPSSPPLASDAYALWLDDVLGSLGLDRVSIVGVSLGGWLALDYATRRPERIERLAVLCPAGIGRQKLGIVFATFALRLFGDRGRRKLSERILGRPPANASPGLKAFINFVALIHEHFRSRMVKIPSFSDEALRRLKMPVLTIAGARDVLLDSVGTRTRLQRHVPRSEVVFLAEAGHVILGQTAKVLAFLTQK